jgi:hypothetical protein
MSRRTTSGWKLSAITSGKPDASLLPRGDNGCPVLPETDGRLELLLNLVNEGGPA